jgi:hypothetical protein
MSKLRLLVVLPAVWLIACAGDPPAWQPDPNPGSDDPGEDPPPDSLGGDGTIPADDGYVPKAFTATRFGVFYQLSGDVLDTYQDPTHGLPQAQGHAWLMTQSHGVAFASRTMADHVHLRDDFYYAPAFDIWDASHNGWQTADDATLQQWAHDFRDAAIASHADLFTFNESPSTTGSNANVRAQIAKILRFLHEPDAMGRQLWGVVYLTEQAATVSKWTATGQDFFQAIDETSVAVVAEHYHSNGFVCSQSESALASHYFAFRNWLNSSGDPAKVSIANKKYTVLHSARYDDGPSGWAGGDATQISLADYQRALSRITKITRETTGGINRISFAPVSDGTTQPGVHPRISLLFRWHYENPTAAAGELPCVGNYAGNCTCQ